MKSVATKIACFASLAIALSLLLPSTAQKEIRSPFEGTGTPASLSIRALDGDADRLQMLDAYSILPLSFEPNRGQTHKRVRFLSRNSGFTLFLTAREAVLVLENESGAAPGKEALSERGKTKPAVVRLKFANGNPRANVIGLDQLHGRSNYLIGSDPDKWHTGIPHYRRVRYQGIYPGIDLIFYGSQGQLEFDFVVDPGADPNVIQIVLEGAERLQIDPLGAVRIRTQAGEIRLQKPFVYQLDNGSRKEVVGAYTIDSNGHLSFELTKYNVRAPLIIDPVLDYSTYFGGKKADQGNAIAVDGLGHVYIAGWTSSLNFPTTANVFQSSLPRSQQNVFVAKIDPASSSLVYSTYLGGRSNDLAFGIAVDVERSVYVTGNTYSNDFPITAGAFQTVLNGDIDVFVTKLNAEGTGLVYSTYLGGSCRNKKSTTELVRTIGIDSDGSAYVVGSSSCVDFPTTTGAFQPMYGGGRRDAFVTKLNQHGNGLAYSTYLGGSEYDYGSGIALDTDGNVYVTGYTESPNFPASGGAFQPTRPGGGDAFVTKLDPAGSALVYSTYLGGTGSSKEIFGKSLPGLDWAEAIAVDTLGYAYVTGETNSQDFPTTLGSFQPIYGGGSSDAFVTKLAQDGSSLIYSTYLGGKSSGGISGEAGLSIAVNGDGHAYATGQTSARNFPITANAFQPLYGGGGDGFVSKLNPDGSGLIYSSYLGGRKKDQSSALALDAAGVVYATGSTSSKDFPTQNATQPTRNGSSDAFVAKIVD